MGEDALRATFMPFGDLVNFEIEEVRAWGIIASGSASGRRLRREERHTGAGRGRAVATRYARR
jgi:hypothetical protein